MRLVKVAFDYRYKFKNRKRLVKHLALTTALLRWMQEPRRSDWARLNLPWLEQKPHGVG